MTNLHGSGTPRATLPWSGPRTDGAVYGKTGILGKYPGPLGALHQRRTLEQLEAILAERLEELRAKPPVGFPRQ